MLCAILFGWTGIHRDLWLWGSLIVAGTLAVIPFIKYPPHENAERDEGDTAEASSSN
jgi:hypothetical protein